MANLNLNIGSGTFWNDIPNSIYLLRFNIAIIFIATIASLFVVVNIFGQTGPAQIFTFMGIICFFAMAIEGLNKNNQFVNFIGLGDNPMMALTAFFVGLIGAYLLLSNVFGGFFSIIPNTYSIVAPTVQWIWVWQVIFSPLLEATFFRGFIFPSLTIYLKNPWLSAITTSLIFGVYHFSAKGGDVALLFGAFIFSIIMILGNQFFKSIGFEYGYHLMNNYFGF